MTKVDRLIHDISIKLKEVQDSMARGIAGASTDEDEGEEAEKDEATAAKGDSKEENADDSQKKDQTESEEKNKEMDAVGIANVELRNGFNELQAMIQGATKDICASSEAKMASFLEKG